MSDRRTCERCGHLGYDVEVKLVRYNESAPSKPVRPYFATELRCVDTAACDTRVPEPAA
jgi:hypothetical protein